MLKRTPSLVFAILLLLVIIGASSLRQTLLNVPRIRVGPLKTTELGKPVLHFFAVGDTGTGGPDQYKVAAAMEARCKEAVKQGLGVDGILLLGDNAYPIGFSSVEDRGWQKKVEVPYGGDCLGNVPIYAVLGNHDYKQNPSAEIEYTLLNPRWHMPNRFYSVDFGSLLRIVAMDSNTSEFCFKPAFCGLDFLFESLREPTTTWTFVMAHHPILSSSDHGFNYQGGVRGMLLRPYLCQRADVYLSGHSHHMEELQEPGCRLAMYVSGGGGGDLYQTVDGVAESKFKKTAFGFLDLTLNAKALGATFIGEDGSELYKNEQQAVSH